MAGERRRYSAARRMGYKRYARVPGQPAAGFPSVSAVMGWLRDMGLIERVDPGPEGDGDAWTNWGGESGFYAVEVTSSTI